MVPGASARRVHAQGQRPPAAGSPPPPLLRTSVLENGLTVAHVERPGLPMVTVQVWYRFGSRNEPVGQRGAARLLERLMADGSARVRPDQHRRYIERVGGQTTALTTEDVTAYHNTVPVEYLELAVELEAERMRSLFIRQDSVEASRQQVVEETRRQESSPLYRVYLHLLAAAFQGGPYAWAPTGVVSELEALSAAKIKALYDTFYVPANAMLIVVGGARAEAVDAAVKRFFAPLERSPAPPAPPAVGDASSVRGESTPAPFGLVMAGYRLPVSDHADTAALQVAGVLLTGGPSSRLHRRLVGGKLADEIGGQVLVRQGAGLLVAYARVASDREAAAVEKAMVAEIARLATAGPTGAELARARAQAAAAGHLGMESATGLANQMGVSWALGGEPSRFLAELDAIDKVTSLAVKKAAASYLARGKAFVTTATSGARTGGGK